MFKEQLKQHWLEYSIIGIWLCNCIIGSFIAIHQVWIPHMDAGWDNYIHIRSAPFDGTVMPITYIPDWTKTENQDKSKRFEDINISEYIPMPTYDASTLARDLNNSTKSSIILHYTYTVPYMWSYRFNYKENDWSHLWIDIRAPIGTPILSIANGVVVRTVEADSTWNKFVVIRHDDIPQNGKKISLYSSYLHLSQITVTEWTKIMKWEMLGRVGQTGIATTPHLHFQIDTADAPFHPYWPFTSSDSKNAGLGFFESINAGLGKENATKYTINPLTFVNTYLWWVTNQGWWVNVNQSLVKDPVTISESLSEDAAFREREIMLWSDEQTNARICEKKRFSDVKETTSLWKMLYQLIDEHCIFQKNGLFWVKDSITKNEAVRNIMDYYKIEPTNGISHFLDIDIDDPMQGYAMIAYTKWIVDWSYFGGEKILTRAELIDLIVRIGNIEKNPSEFKIYSDTNIGIPYYNSIQAYWLITKTRWWRFYPNAIATNSSLVQFLYAIKNQKN